MKQDRIVALIFIVIDIVLAVVCGILYFRIDRVAPEFKFSSGETAGTGDEDMSLLEGVTAFDDRDGDVTDRIVIEKVIEDGKGGSLVVFYAVSDSAGNVAKASRRQPLGEKEKAEVAANMLGSSGSGRKWEDEKAAETGESGPGADAAAGEEDAAGNGGNAGESEAENDRNAEEAGAENDRNAEEAGAENGGNTEEAGAENDRNAEEAGAENDRNAGEAGEENGGNAEEVRAENDRNAEEVRAEKAGAENSGASPTLSLRQQEVTTPAGIAPAWVTVIGVLTDDKDSYETLFRNLSVSKYDVNTPGTYSVTLTTEDSDGNKSRSVPLTIIVEESR